MAGLTNLNPFVLVNCATADSSQGLVFDDNKLVIEHGSETVASMNMAAFFQPCDTYSVQQFTLNGGDTTFIEPANQGDPIMVIIYVTFPDPDGTNEDLKWLEWSYPPNSFSPPGPTMKMGRLTVLSGTTGNGWDLGTLGGLQVYNPQLFAVVVRVMILNGS
jgi:hypothetical protein